MSGPESVDPAATWALPRRDAPSVTAEPARRRNRKPFLERKGPPGLTGWAMDRLDGDGVTVGLAVDHMPPAPDSMPEPEFMRLERIIFLLFMGFFIFLELRFIGRCS